MRILQSAAQRQSVVMTGNMQQAIALLQLSNTDLQSYIEKEAEENPFIEVENSLRPVPSLPSSGGRQGDLDDPVSRLADHPPSLYGHISNQFDMIFTDPADRMIADRYLEAIDQNGWLAEPLDQIAASCGLTLAEAEEMLHLVQQVEPAGVFARNLAECLSIQAHEQGILTDVFRRVLDNLPRLAAADLTGLARVCGCSMEELGCTLKKLRGLNPKPGADYSLGGITEREPDLIVTRKGDGWSVELNRSTLPSVAISAVSKAVSRCNRHTQDYVSERLGVARWLRRAVEHRNHTTLAVGSEIVRRQQAFLAKGHAFIAPMTLADVAQSVGVHESTVSRVTTGTMIATPHGTLSLKRLFSTALHSNIGEEGASAAAIRFKLQKLVAGEDPKNPLSDDALAKAINEGGTVLARRTIAKYRDMLSIPSSFQRKRLGKLNMA